MYILALLTVVVNTYLTIDLIRCVAIIVVVLATYPVDACSDTAGRFFAKG
jgi:hypothetical protein